MLPIKLTTADSEEERKRWKIVRRDTFDDVPGLIQSASTETGLCLMMLSNGEKQEYNFGSNGLAIVSASR